MNFCFFELPWTPDISGHTDENPVPKVLFMFKNLLNGKISVFFVNRSLSVPKILQEIWGKPKLFLCLHYLDFVFWRQRRMEGGSLQLYLWMKWGAEKREGFPSKSGFFHSWTCICKLQTYLSYTPRTEGKEGEKGHFLLHCKKRIATFQNSKLYFKT